MNERDELAELIQKYAATTPADWLYDDEAKHIADALLAAGWVKSEPAWAETLDNDGTYEYTSSSHCDGTHIAHWRRKPAMRGEVSVGPWEIYEPSKP